jgi:YidC/Oxa1 family membrane protein insertase
LDTSRFLIAFLLLIALTALYPEVVQWLYPRHAVTHRAEHVKETAKPAATKPAVTLTPTPLPAATPLPAERAEVPATEGGLSVPLAGAPATGLQRTVRVDTSFYEAVLTTRGARLQSFKLKRYRETAARNSPPYEMVARAARLPFGVAISRDSGIADDRAIDYRTDAPSKIDLAPGKQVTITFTGSTRNGLTLEKSFVFGDRGYVFDVRTRVSGPSGKVPALIGFTMSQPLTARAGYRDYPGVQADVNGKTVTEYEKELTKGVAPLSGSITWAGFGDRYFLAAFLPKTKESGTLRMGFSGGEAEAVMLFAGTRLDATVYMGPKELNLLEAANPYLSKAIDLGWFGIIALPFLRALNVFHDIAPNYGVDIILLTVVLRILTLPMSVKSQRSMMRLQRLQPQVERIREKFKDDTERLNREMMDLYKRNHVNPLGGCLPTLIQLPVFIGLYEALLNAVELRHAPFIAWMKDLSAPDCYPVSWMPKLPLMDCHGIPVLVLLMGVSAFAQQWMSPSSPDPNQQRMMMVMPVVFTLIFVNFPAGLSLYYLASNVLGIVQQFFLNREFKQFSPVATT